MAKKNSDSSIPELIKSIRYSFRQCEFDEFRNVLMGREESMKVEIENLAKEGDSLKAELDSLQMTQGFTELEKISAEEKLGRSERRCEELDKLIVGMREDIEKLRGEKLNLEEKVVSESRKMEMSDETLVKMQEENDILRSLKMDLEEKSEEKDERLIRMEEELEDLRQENAYANKCLEELKAKKIEVSGKSGEDSPLKEKEDCMPFERKGRCRRSARNYFPNTKIEDEKGNASCSTETAFVVVDQCDKRRKTAVPWTFVRTLTKWDIRNGRMELPKKFVSETGISRCSEIMLQDVKGRMWPVKITDRNRSVYSMSSGWVKFVKANKLNRGTNLLFEFVPGSNIVVKVTETV